MLLAASAGSSGCTGGPGGVEEAASVPGSGDTRCAAIGAPRSVAPIEAPTPGPSVRSYTGGELPRGRFVLRSVAMAMSRHVFGSEQLVSRQVGLALEIGDGEYTSAAVTSTGEIERQKGTFTATDTQISFEPSCGPESPARGTAVRLGPQTDYDVESDTIGMRANVRDTADGSDGATFIPVNIVLERE